MVAGLLAGSAVAAPTVEEGVLEGAPYRISIPDGKVEGLVLWAHGYQIASQGYRGFDRDMGAIVCPIVMERGFACAQSAFSRQGFAIEQGVLETEALRRHYVETHGRPKLTIMAGSHMGGFITYIMMEKYPTVYDGGLASGANNEPKLVHLKERLFDIRLLFDQYFPGLPGSVVDFPLGDQTMQASVAKARELTEGQEERLAAFALAAGFRNTEGLARTVGFYAEVLRELNERAGGNPFSNTNTIYTVGGSAEEEARINAQIPRYTADPAAQAYLREWYTPTGRIERPLLAVNKLIDDVSPVEPTRYYDTLTQIAGTSDLFVQKFFTRTEGPSLVGEEFSLAFDQLLDWIRNGKKPEPGLLAPEGR
ncbi:MAG: hypothetical protein HXY25_01570 [Alphaproteobacteria bacterium]|nr:hypothetical protein [Alphaproteobacteria bacterium]